MEIEEKLETFFKKVNGGYFGILTSISGTITIVIAVILYSISIPISLQLHWISHLGAGPNGAQYIFTIGLIITAIFAIPFLLQLFLLLRENTDKHKLMWVCTFIIAMIAIAGLIINAIFNMRDNPNLHVTGSTTFFFGGFFMIILCSLLMFFHPEFPKSQALIGIIVSGFFAAFLISFLPLMVDPNINLMELLTTSDPIAGTTRFLEWLVLFAILFWFLEIGIYLIKKK
ncbi:MAG: hypothetical protein ACTSPD_11655 [Promethearchaeota archaeon]